MARSLETHHASSSLSFTSLLSANVLTLVVVKVSFNVQLSRFISELTLERSLTFVNNVKELCEYDDGSKIRIGK